MSEHTASSPFSSPLQPSGIPLYLQVKRAVLDALAQGEWKQGDAIPSEKIMAARFGVSIGTLRKAIDELAAENILVRHQGRGTFVALHTRNQHFFRFFRIVRQDAVKAYPSTELKEFKQAAASVEVQDKLNLPKKSQVYQFLNVLSLHNKQILVDDICVPERLFHGLSYEQLDQRPNTLYSFYQETFGINVIGTTEHVRVTVATPKLAELLDVESGHPLLQIRRVAYSFNNEPVEWRISYVNTDNYEYVGQVHQSD